MSIRRVSKLAALCGLTAGLFLLAASEQLSAADNKVRDAARYTRELRTSKDPKVRAEALTELGKLGQIQKILVASAMDDITKALEDKNAQVRAAAARTLGMIDPDPKVAVPVLLNLVKKDKVDSVRIAAIQGLGSMGANAKSANKELRGLMKKEDDKKSKLRRAAQMALRQINPKKQ
jgi:HEAT repeat protein